MLLEGKKVVFVLGAGSSCDFGFPVGDGLSQHILNDNHDFIKNIFPEGHVEDFKFVFARSGLGSIDAFLEKTLSHDYGNEFFYEIGKSMIANIILRRETPADMLSRNHWYHWLFNILKDDLACLTDGRVRFVTFNYDLSFEQFFYQTILYTLYGRAQTTTQQEEVQDILFKMDIVHLYGRLGVLKWEKSEARVQERRDYGCFNSTSDIFTKQNLIKICAKYIDLVRQGDPADQTQNAFNKAAGHLSQADYVYFLGFSYNRVNMQRLFKNASVGTLIKYFMSGFGVHQAERNMTDKMLIRGANGRKEVVWGNIHDDIATFMRKTFDCWY